MGYSMCGLILQFLLINLLIAADGNAQKSLSVQDVFVPLEVGKSTSKELFAQIEGNTGFKFVYDGRRFDSGTSINIKKDNMSVAEVLLTIAEKTNVRFKRVNDNISLYLPDNPKGKKVPYIIEQVDVTGRIIADDGEPLPGVAIIIKGTVQGTVSDVDGRYTLSVDDNIDAILVFSFVGMETTEVALGNRSVIDVTMVADIAQLTELVVTALGIERKKESLSYAVSEISGEQIAEKSEPDIIRALSGKVAGVNITGSGGASGSSTNIVIRGNNSATGNNQPLFVVDGVPFDNTLTNTADPGGAASTYSNRALDLDPNDVASITVLKGGAAAALYGTRAANGVIIVTTHSGKSSKKGLEVTVSSTVAFESVARLPDYQNEYGQGGFSNGQYTFASGATESWGPAFDDPNLDGNGGLFSEGGRIVYTNHLGDNVPYQAFPDNVKDFYQTGVHLENSVRVSGGSEISRFALTASTVDNDGFIPNTGIKRKSIKLRGSTILENRLEVDATVSYVNTHQDGILSGGHGSLSSINRQTLFTPRSYDLGGFDYIDPVTGAGLYHNFWDSPNWLIEEGPYDSDVDRIYGNVGLTLPILDWLSISYKIGGNTYNDRRNQIIPVGSFNERQGRISNHSIFFSEVNSDFFVTASQDLSNDLNLRFIVGQNFNQREFDENNIKGVGIITRGIRRLSNAQSLVTDASRQTKRRIMGVFGDVTLSYKDYLYLNATGRNDWSSTLPEGNRGFFYPSVSTSFIFTEALDIQNQFLSFGKLRIAYAKIGNDAEPYLLSAVNQVNPTSNNNDLPFNGISGATIGNNQGNQDLKPEFTTEFEIGTELRLLQNKVGIDFSYYNKSTDNQIFSVAVPSATGFLTKTLNAGEISNKGFEIGLDATPINLPNGISWNIFAAFSRNVSKVESLTGGIDQINPGLRGGDYGNILKVGEPYGTIEGTLVQRDSEGNLLLGSTTGLPFKDAVPGIVGDPNPDFLLGVTNTLSYKGFTLGFLVDLKKGGDILALSNGYLRGFGIATETAGNRNRTYIIPGFIADPADQTQALLDENGNKTVNNVPVSPQNFWSAAASGINTNQYRFAAEAMIYDATVYRLREVSLTYRFPDKLLSNLPFGSASLTFVGRNLWFLAPNLPHLDPEVSTYGAGNAQGIDQYAPPTVKNYGFNVKLTF